ncbi:MAG TPA: hypothetical protein VFH78_09140 [Candidatus Thermoplasmatota archaeon]|nr:hypothetical protein [Candidatus Thermoplasmatota archaeon]
MKPVLSAWPAKKRTLSFAPFAAGIFLLSFLIVAFSTQNILLALLLPPVIAVGGAWALVGWPELRMKDGKPLVDPRVKPYLFFVLAPLLALVLYPILGVLLTQAGVPLKRLALVSIALSVLAAVALAYYLVGVPNVFAIARKQYADIPPERRPYLFFPLFVLFFLVLFLTLGVVSTRLVGRISPTDPAALLNIQVLVLLPLCILIAALLAWLLVGIPKVLTAPAHHIPRVPGRHRPRAFLATLVLAGILLTYGVGALLTFFTPLSSALVLPLALLVGYGLATGIAFLAWGTPARWRSYEDYRPILPPEARMPLRIVLAIGLGLAAAVAIGLAGIDLFWGALVGLLVAGVAALVVTGTHRRILARRGESTLVPDLPDALKPLILFPTWIVISFILFAVLTYLLPGLVAVNVVVGVTVGLLVAFLLLEQPLLQELREERRRERQKRKEWEARRRARLEEAEKGTPPPEA